jgi:hypothetical protein
MFILVADAAHIVLSWASSGGCRQSQTTQFAIVAKHLREDLHLAASTATSMVQNDIRDIMVSHISLPIIVGWTDGGENNI